MLLLEFRPPKAPVEGLEENAPEPNAPPPPKAAEPPLKAAKPVAGAAPPNVDGVVLGWLLGCPKLPAATPNVEGCPNDDFPNAEVVDPNADEVDVDCCPKPVWPNAGVLDAPNADCADC